MGLRHVGLTGEPGVGKTTLFNKICETLKNSDQILIKGFYTKEVRSEKGSRLGFDLMSINNDSKECTLATLASNGSGRHRVGRYEVFVDEFERKALSILDQIEESNCVKAVVAIDEIGKMELLSKAFASRVQQLLEHSQVLCTLPLKSASIPFVESIKRREDLKLFHKASVIFRALSALYSHRKVTRANRDHLMEEVVHYIRSS